MDANLRPFSATLMSFLVLYFLLTPFVWSDKGYYENSDAAFAANSNVNLLSPPTVRNEIVTSNVYDSGTADDVKITYVGTFSSSGPHSLGSFVRASTRTVDIPLDRKIGEIVNVVIESGGTDSWLLAGLRCEMLGVRYELKDPQMWLETMDPIAEALYDNAFSPDAQIDLQSSSKLILPVVDQYYVYTETGLIS